MDVSRLRRGELIAGVCGLLLFIFMFLNWFSAPGADEFDQAREAAEQLGIATPDVDTSINAWESFDFIDIVLLLTAIVAVGLAVMTAMSRSVSLPVAASALTAGLGILATLLVLYRVIDPVSELDREFGLFLGLLAAAGVAYGGWRSMQEEGTTFSGQADRLQDRFGDDQPPPPPPPSSSSTGGPPPPPPSA